MTTLDHTQDDGQLIRPDTAMLHPSPTNPRLRFDPAALAELADSIKQHGIMQPIVCREMPDAMRTELGTEARLEIVAGERRWRAAQLAGLDSVPALLRTLTDAQVVSLQIIENLQREGLSPIEEAEGYGRLMAQGLTANQVSDTVGKSKAYVYAKLKLRALCPHVAQALHQGKLSESIALQIARIPVPDMQRDALAVVTQPNEYSGEPMSFRQAKAHILQSYTRNLAKAAFDPTDPSLQPAERLASTCTNCLHRLGNQPGTEPAHANVCTDPSCYDVKTTTHNLRRLGPDAENAPPVDIPRANPKSVTTYADFDAAGYRLLSGINHADPQRRTYRDWLDAHGEAIPCHIHVCPISGNAQIVATKADLSSAAERIAKSQHQETSTEPAAAEAPAIPPAATNPADHFPDTRKMVTPAPPAPATPIKPFGNEQYLTALRRACRTSAPMFFITPALTRLIARWIASKVGGHIPDDASEPDCIAAIVAYLTDTATHHGAAALEELAQAININPADIREAHTPAVHAVSSPVRYRHPNIPGLTWTGKGRKPQWVADWISAGKPLADIEAHREEAKA